MSECQGTFCSKQAEYLKFKGEQRDSNPQSLAVTIINLLDILEKVKYLEICYRKLFSVIQIWRYDFIFILILVLYSVNLFPIIYRGWGFWKIIEGEGAQDFLMEVIFMEGLLSIEKGLSYAF